MKNMFCFDRIHSLRNGIFMICHFLYVVSQAQQNRVINGKLDQDLIRTEWSEEKFTGFLEESGCVRYLNPKIDFSREYDNQLDKFPDRRYFKWLTLFDASNKDFWELYNIAARFECPLLKNNKYKVTFDLAEDVNTIAWFKAEILITDSLFANIIQDYQGECNYCHVTPSSYTFQLNKPKSKLQTYTFEYTAKGGEKYMYIGNLNAATPPKSKWVGLVREKHKVRVNYKIFDIAVKPIDSSDSCEVISDTKNVITTTAEKKFFPWDSMFVYLFDAVCFKSGTFELSDSAMQQINILADVFFQLKGHHTLLILGHTDNQGQEPYNLHLSQRRAESVRDKLVELGISSDRITAKGCGSDEPIADNNTEYGRSQNRRVEVVFKPSD